MVFPTFFAIENSLSFAESNASNIMNQILKFAEKLVKRLPLKWLRVQQEIQKLKEKHIYLPTNEVIALVDQCGVKQEGQKVLLEYLHDLGEILYFPDDEALKDNIVLDSVRIVDMLKTIITVIDRKLREPRLRDAWRKLDKGILEEHLLRHLWEKFNFSDETFDFFVSLMQKFGLVCERKTTKGSERIFYVLSRLKPERVDTSPIDYNGKGTVSIFHDFGNYLPDDVFQRGATKFIERFQVEDSEAKLSYEHVELDIDQHHQVLLDVATIKHRRMFQTTIIRRTILNRSNPTEEDKKDDPSPEVCKKVLKFLESALKVFCQSGGRGVELTMYIRCVCSPNIRDAHMHIVRTFHKDVLPCGSNGMEVMRYRRLFGDNILPQDKHKPNSALPQPQRTQTKPKDFVDDAIIATVSEEIDPGWRRFGVRLGLQWSDVTKYNADGRQTHQAVDKMIKFWRSNVSNEKHQLKAVCTALTQHNRRNLAKKVSKGDVSDGTPVNTKQSEIFDDHDLLFICDSLDPESWRRLGVRLGLKWTDINGIATNNKLVKDRIMEMLVTWRDGQSINHIPTMIHALRQQKLVQLAELVCKRHGYGLHSPLVPGFLADFDMVFIAEKLDANWQSLGISLGMNQCEIKQIKSDFSPPMVDAIIEMLIKWRASQNAKVNQLEMISIALDKHGRKDIVEALHTSYHNEDDLHSKYLPTWVEQMEVYV
ncbi:uncharacterized protein LOC117112257 [Anneissia japonica]|uniref:uncharacterized protein LOC117112257 n=1 Tax=Anneissia japonica TaxID=1529436 RepID=UPI001425935B|nr:uncharacterized protein LOC117112257 [Anneissia japonica]